MKLPDNRWKRVTRILACTVPLLSLSAAAQQDDAAEEREPSEKVLVEAVNTAVERGLGWLQRKQNADGGYGTYHFHSELDYPAGQTALALLARIASGENQHSDEAKAGFRYIREHPPRLTYGIGLTLMAWDMKAAPVNERFQVGKLSEEERREYQWPRALDDSEVEFLTSLVRTLEREAKEGWWSYGDARAAATTGEADASNTQYAVLGLKAASRCGIDFDRTVFADTLKHFIKHQEPNGEKVRYIDLVESSTGKVKKYTKQLRARSWGYDFASRGGDQVSATRTNIGIACLVLTLDELLQKGKGGALKVGKKHKKDVTKGVLDALAWLDRYFSVERNHPHEPGAGYYYYYLYSLERTGMLTSRRYIGEHDWYREGAIQLLKLQREDGSWPGVGWDNELVNTCFALLFLRRATIPGPVTTGR